MSRSQIYTDTDVISRGASLNYSEPDHPLPVRVPKRRAARLLRSRSHGTQSTLDRGSFIIVKHRSQLSPQRRHEPSLLEDGSHSRLRESALSWRIESPDDDPIVGARCLNARSAQMNTALLALASSTPVRVSGRASTVIRRGTESSSGVFYLPLTGLVHECERPINLRGDVGRQSRARPASSCAPSCDQCRAGTGGGVRTSSPRFGPPLQGGLPPASLPQFGRH